MNSNIEVFSNDCYKINLVNTTNNPFLKSINAVFILSMENSERLKTRQPELFQLGKYTYVQYNKGFKNCKKDKLITDATLDVLDAFKNVCEYNKYKNENIIILEDDAFIINFDRDKYNEINNFIQKNDFDIYSFGSMGLQFYNPIDNHHKFYLNFLGTMHALIWSPKAIKFYLNQEWLDKEHFSYNFNTKNYTMDNGIMSKLKNKFGYKIPLIVQSLPETPSLKVWDKTGIKSNMIKSIKIDKENFSNLLNGWNFIYFLNHWLIPIIVFIIFITIFIYIIFINKKNKYK